MGKFFPTGAGQNVRSGAKPFGGLKQNDNSLGLTGVGAPSWGLKALGIGNTSIGTNPSAPLGVKKPSNPLGEKACNVKNPSTSLGVNTCDGKNLSTSLGVNTCDGKNPSTSGAKSSTQTTSSGGETVEEWLKNLRDRAVGDFSDNEAVELFGFEDDSDTDGSADEELEGDPRDLLLAFYRLAMPAQNEGPISIQMLKEFFGNVKKENPEFIRVFLKYCQGDTSRGIVNRVESTLATYRRLEYVIQYSQAFKQFAEAVTTKILAPEDNILEKIKWLKIWIFILKNQNYFDFDMFTGKDGREYRRTLGDLERIDEYVLFADSFMKYKGGLVKVRDGEFIQELMQRMIELFPKNVQTAVLQYGEFTKDESVHFKVAAIRENVKKLIFKRPWCSQSWRFCTVSGIKEIDERKLQDAVIAYCNGGIERMHSFIVPYQSAYKGERRNTKEMTCYAYGVITRNGEKIPVGVSCKEELQMYVEVYEWLLKHREFKFGTQDKTIYEYGMENLLDGLNSENMPAKPEEQTVIEVLEDLTEAQALVKKYGAIMTVEERHAAKWIDNWKNFNISEFEEMLVLMEETLKKAAKYGSDDTLLESVLQEDFICILLLRALHQNLKDLKKLFNKTNFATVEKVAKWISRYSAFL